MIPMDSQSATFYGTEYSNARKTRHSELFMVVERNIKEVECLDQFAERTAREVRNRSQGCIPSFQLGLR